MVKTKPVTAKAAPAPTIKPTSPAPINAAAENRRAGVGTGLGAPACVLSEVMWLPTLLIVSRAVVRPMVSAVRPVAR
jgi:hypothetical protein